MGEWISVDERLPEEGTNVLVVYQFGSAPETVDIWAATYEGEDAGSGELYWRDGEDFLEVTHWMPLPPLPGELGVRCGVRGSQLRALEPRWVGRLRHYARRVRFGLHMVRKVFEWWTPSWRRTPLDREPDDYELDLRTALAVAWIVWK